MEYRTFNVTSLCVQKREKDERRKITGHAAVFDVIGEGGWFREKVAPGAFRNTIEQDDVRALFNHDPNFVLGRNKAGTLSMREDDKGLLVEIDPPDTQFAGDLMRSIDRGDITQMSFGFEILKEERVAGEGKEQDLFILKEVRLWDVSPVTFPFYKQTDVSVHSRQAWSDAQKRAVVEALQNKGFRVGVLKKRSTLKRRFKRWTN
jgi:HK97 family phage prohead protease